MCVFLQMGKQIAALDSMSHRSIFNEYVNTIQPYLFTSVIILLKKRVVFTWSRKIELWTNDDLRWWCCLEKERVENEKRSFANKKSQIEKRNNQVVLKIKTLHVSSVDNTPWKLLERESWWTVSQNLQTHFDELLLLLCFDTMVH